MRELMVLLALSIALVAGAAVKECENIVVNGRLEADQVEVPLYWESPANARVGKDVFYDQAGGPKGIPCVRFVNGSEKPLTFTFRQYRYTLVPGARYRISAFVRTKGYTGEGGVLVVNSGWLKTIGLTGFHADSEWKRHELEFEMIPTNDRTVYSVAVHLNRFQGEIAFADLRLEAKDRDALQGTIPPAIGSGERVPRFFPWSPRLGRIDASNRKVSFFFTGELPDGDRFADYTVTVQTPAGKTSSVLRDGANWFVLPAGSDAGCLSYVVRKKGAADSLLAGTFPFRVVCIPKVEAIGHRRMNNFVTEILSAAVFGKFSREFQVTRDGWVFVRLETDEPCRMELDGEELPQDVASGREYFREMGTGAHRISVDGCREGKMVVRQIAEIYDDAACFDSYVTNNPSYGWNFFSRHVMPNATTFEGGILPEEHRVEFRNKGGRWSKAVISRYRGPDELPGLIFRSSGMIDVWQSGVSLDEQFFGQSDSIEPYIGGMRKFLKDYDGDRIVNSFLVGKPVLPGSDREALALAVNASFGKGKALSEIYCRTKATEDEARSYLDDYIGETLRKVKELRPGVPYYPDVIGNFGIVLGNFSQIPTLSIWYHPEVDFKYYLDMQFNAIANDPTYEGLGLIGVWGSHYTDEELHRWSFMLTRHYCIEGRKDMLSKRYGLKYLPGTVVNGDFRESLQGWRIEGEVKRESIYKFSDSAERRWCGDQGDSFAVLVKKDGKMAKVGQMISNLEPGRTYSLDVVCFDAHDARTKAHRPHRVPIEVRLGSAAKRIQDLSWVFVDERPARTDRYEAAKVNRHHIVFTAEATEIPLMVNNAPAPEGSEIGINGIGVWPYIPAE